MSKKRLIDATDLVRRVLEERDKIRTEVVERYSFGVSVPDRHGQAMRGGIRKALREIETSPTVDAVEVVRCDECIFAKNFRSAYVDCKCWRASVPRDGFCYNGERNMDAEVQDVDK